MDKIKKTGNSYGLLWQDFTGDDLPASYHFDEIEELVSENIVRGSKGIDAGSGCGYDTFRMAKRNPTVKITSLDISDGIYKGKKIASGLKNAWFLKGSVLELPIKDCVFDFAYSFGVLHHLPDPYDGFKEIARVLKFNSPIFVYLYEDHHTNTLKYLGLKIVSGARKITTRMPPRLLYAFCYLFSPVMIILFTYPAKILSRIKYTARFSRRAPFNFGTDLFSLSGDLYDRFATPIEHRFTREQCLDMFEKNNFYNVKIAKLESVAGWVVWGYKK